MRESTDLVESARSLGLRSMPVASIESGWAALSFSPDDARMFLNIVTPLPQSEDDGLALRIMGRPQDLTQDDEPWRFECLAGDAPDGGWGLRIIINVPPADVGEVAARLTRR